MGKVNKIEGLSRSPSILFKSVWTSDHLATAFFKVEPAESLTP